MRLNSLTLAGLLLSVRSVEGQFDEAGWGWGAPDMMINRHTPYVRGASLIDSF